MFIDEFNQNPKIFISIMIILWLICFCIICKILKGIPFELILLLMGIIGSFVVFFTVVAPFFVLSVTVSVYGLYRLHKKITENS